MRNRDRFLILLPLLLTLAAPAGAQTQADKTKPKPAPPNPYEDRFRELDSNRDNYVTPSEWPLERAKFDLVDRNKDGRLSRTELLTPNVVRDRDELNARLRQADTNRDGILSPAERRRAEEAANAAANRARAREGTWNPRATLQDQRRFENLDRDRDNRLERRELRGTNAGARFDRLDRNRDGVISPNEWPRQ
jgi:Ca2+-binding EF-hand superfamily protein